MDAIDRQNYVKYLYEHSRTLDVEPTVTLMQDRRGFVHIYQGKGKRSKKELAEYLEKVAKSLRNEGQRFNS